MRCGSIARLVQPIATMACVLAIFAAPAHAQNLTSAGIDGFVSDDSGAALPGVTVTASSPALQVQQVATITDGQGRYRFIDLPRGSYRSSSSWPASIRWCGRDSN